MTAIDVHTAAQACQDASVVLVDIRSSSDWLKGVPQHAKLWSETVLRNRAKQLILDDKKVYIICYRGQTSAELTKKLRQQWGDCFFSVEGGFAAWQAQGLAVEQPTQTPVVDRYQRQIKLPGFGQQAQQRLKNSHVLVVGAGGLGSPALLYLAGAGLGQITLIDDDVVSLHNLHRQILYQQDDVGLTKSEVAKQRLEALNDSIEIRALNQRLTTENVDMLLNGVDLVIDGSDNINSRYVINDACLKHNKPWLFAAVSDFNIQLALFSGNKLRPCYRCLFPNLDDKNIANCSEGGVLGPVPGLAGILQACEAIKYLAGLGDCLAENMLSYDVLHHHFKVLKYPTQINEDCNH